MPRRHWLCSGCRVRCERLSWCAFLVIKTKPISLHGTISFWLYLCYNLSCTVNCVKFIQLSSVRCFVTSSKRKAAHGSLSWISSLFQTNLLFNASLDFLSVKAVLPLLSAMEQKWCLCFHTIALNKSADLFLLWVVFLYGFAENCFNRKTCTR